MNLEFIDNNKFSINHAARKRIRSHAASGKNVGKKIVRPSRKNAQSLGVKITPTVPPRYLKESDTSDESENSVISVIHNPLDDGLSVLPIPEGSKIFTIRAIAFLSGPRFVPALSNAMDSDGHHSEAWTGLMFKDEALFHCVLALSLIALNKCLPEPEDPLLAARHLSHTFTLINRRLSEGNSITDATIAVVLMLAQYESHNNQHKQAMIHYQGLERMLELRGGISSLRESMPILAFKIIRTHLDHCLRTGSPVRFSGDILCEQNTVLESLKWLRKYSSNERLRHYQFFDILGTSLQNLLMDIKILAQLLNGADCGHSPKVDCDAFHKTALLLLHNILSIKSINSYWFPNTTEDVIHIGLVAFLSTFMPALDRSVPDNPLLRRSLRHTIATFTPKFPEDNEVLLWLLFMGAASVFRSDDYSWLLPATARTMSGMGLCTWDDVRNLLSIFPWVYSIHNDAAHALFNCIFSA